MSPAEHAADGRPNVLLITADQLRFDHVGFGGNAVVATPNLDALAARGRVFDNAYVTNPTCQPNRSTMITGQMPSVHGTRHNGIALDLQRRTVIEQIAAAGYATGLVGKSHLQNMGVGGEVAHRSFDRTQPADAQRRDYPDGWDRLEHIDAYNDGAPDLPNSFYGFEHVEFTVGHGDAMSGHYRRWLDAQGVDWREWQGPRNALERCDFWDDIYKPRLPVELYPTTWVADQSIDFVNRHDDQPWLLHCSFADPHHPFTPPGDFWDMFHPSDVVVSPTVDDPHADSMDYLRRIAGDRGGRIAVSPAMKGITADQMREVLAREYGAIALIDREIGRLLAAAEPAANGRETVVIFTSDHGDLMGDHGLILKLSCAYQGVIRVPLVIAGPSVAPGRTASMASTVDLAPTMLDVTAAEPYWGMQGHSLVPIVDDPAASVRDEVLIEEDQIRDPIGAGVQPRMRTLVTADTRITYYQGLEHGELFDLADDPHELANRWNDPAAQTTRSDMTDRLLQAMLAHADPSVRPTHLG